MQPAETPAGPEGTGVLRPTMMRPAPPRSTAQVVGGLVLVVPAFVLLVVSYVGPLIWTVNSGFHKLNVLRASGRGGGDNGPFTGANYSRAFDTGLGRSLGYALSLAIVPIVVVLIAAPVLAWAAHSGGLVARWVTRGLLALPLAAYAPTALAVAHLVDAKGKANGANIEGFARSAYWWGTFGLFAALGVTLFLATLRRRDSARRPYAAAIVAGVIALAAVLAAALQEFVYPWVISGRPITPTTFMFVNGFSFGNFGVAAAASTLMLAALLLLGAGITVLIVRSGLRLEFDKPWRSADERTTPSARRLAGLAVGGLVVLIVLALTVIGLWPLLSHLGGTGRTAAAGATIAVNTWMPPLFSTIVGVLVATLAAAGISWLRPFGRHSEWLLLPFGLFLFVGIGPLALRAYASGAVAGRLNSFLGLVPPVWVALPALFVLALMLRGQAVRGEARRQEGRPVPAGRLLLPVLPMVGLVFVVTWVVQAQNLLWPLISATDEAHDTGSAALLRATVNSGYTGERSLPYSLGLPIAVFVLLFLGAVAVQLTYLDRVALRIGRPERDGPPRT